MKTNLKTRRGFTLVELLVVIVIIASLAGLTAPMVIRQRKKADQTQAVNNARQIGFAMFEFESEYGRFPDSNSANEVMINTETTVPMTGTDSNSYFRQLMGAGYTQSEAMFYAKVPGSKKPDGNIESTSALDTGEVGFGYILAGTNGISTAGNPARPYVVTPLLGTSGDQFDKDPFDGKAVILRIDNSVTSLQILPSTKKINLSPGNDLLKVGPSTVWGNSTSGAPTLAFPKLNF
ncbi:MAG: prepilin-type N-terminal cleavage/methylation domain-containing protein [Akkermansiaceae bacterium]|nr:prepilin-type N-terminal cleavage/methylation domain-containing protein [Akkermansiaceae bacterium]